MHKLPGVRGEPNDGLGFYHMGFYEDLIQILDTVRGTETTVDEDEEGEGVSFNSGGGRCT